MADTKLYRIVAGKAEEIPSETVTLEKSLQALLESNLDTLMAIRLVASEHSTGKQHGGRIDSLGLDENNSPVVLEYKRSTNETVINQGLFYLDWLMDHQAEFELLVQRKLGQEVASNIDWSEPRLVCVAADYTKYDIHAVRQINRNIELFRHKFFGNELLVLELVNAVSGETSTRTKTTAKARSSPVEISGPSVPLAELFEDLKAFALALGDDVTHHELKHYQAFRRIRNFACVWIGTKEISIWLRLDAAKTVMEDGFSRDVSKIGHLGTGDVEVSFRDRNGLEKAKAMVLKAYQEG
jgi:predicted transport protein